LGGKMEIEEINDEIVEKAKIEVLNKWKSLGVDVDEAKKINIEEYVNRFNITDEYKKKLIKEILKIGIEKDVILDFPYVKNLSIRLINGLIINDLDKMSYDELTLLYKKMLSADLKKLFFTRKSHFWYWQ
jgi:hypothetical protein